MRGGRVLIVLSFLLSASYGAMASEPMPDESPVAIEPAGPVLCIDLPPLEDGTFPLSHDIVCPHAIRPGARMNSPAGCTMNFVVTDGEDHYIGTAGHCTGYVGQNVYLDGIGHIGQVALKNSGGGDWAFVRIVDSKEHLIDGTICRFGGPRAGPTGEAVRDPLNGEPVLHYGHGVGFGQFDATKARAGGGTVVSPVNFSLVPGRTNLFTFVGDVGGGDSGSPVVLASGEAAGIVSAHLTPFRGGLLAGLVPGLVYAYRFTSAMDALSAELGKEVTLVEGRVLPPEAPEPPL